MVEFIGVFAWFFIFKNELKPLTRCAALGSRTWRAQSEQTKSSLLSFLLQPRLNACSFRRALQHGMMLHCPGLSDLISIHENLM